MESIVCRLPLELVLDLLTDPLQHYGFQRRYRRPLRFHPPVQGHHVHLQCLPSPDFTHRPFGPSRTLRRQHSQSSGVRYE